jgi:hypothetical protein
LGQPNRHAPATQALGTDLYKKELEALAAAIEKIFRRPKALRTRPLRPKSTSSMPIRSSQITPCRRVAALDESREQYEAALKRAKQRAAPGD